MYLCFVSAGCMIAKREQNGILYFRAYSCHSRLLWLENPFWRPVNHHPNLFTMGTLFWRSRSLTIVRGKQRSVGAAVPECQSF